MSSAQATLSMISRIRSPGLVLLERRVARGVRLRRRGSGGPPGRCRFRMPSGRPRRARRTARAASPGPRWWRGRRDIRRGAGPCERAGEQQAGEADRVDHRVGARLVGDVLIVGVADRHADLEVGGELAGGEDDQDRAVVAAGRDQQRRGAVDVRRLERSRRGWRRRAAPRRRTRSARSSACSRRIDDDDPLRVDAARRAAPPSPWLLLTPIAGEDDMVARGFSGSVA